LQQINKERCANGSNEAKEVAYETSVFNETANKNKRAKLKNQISLKQKEALIALRESIRSRKRDKASRAMTLYG